MDRTRPDTLETFHHQFKEITFIYQQAASQYNITINEFWVWYSLVALGGVQSQQSICETWLLSKQTINSVVKSMMRRGYVYLETIPGTRNRKEIKLTAQGRKFGEEVISKVHHAEQRATAQLTREELSFCSELLEKYLGFLREEL